MFTPMTLGLVGLGAAVLVVGGGYLFLRFRGPKPEEPLYHFRCPGCKRRLGYHKRQRGHAGQCPRCKNAITCPVTPEV
jgi:hypothetical protein